ncbi:hypothetical protein BDZ85DRAFT_51880 [Elsinoe ampelina]|uniref:Uncharacterized protein n=1 Tax=Elsinoe ampelina TaxID=302913 RepID=A0A6A6GLJ3_9PEZI|nr:hypothetical protein BDZ85DRAFT_51880 [Elsinoe ampelina]
MTACDSVPCWTVTGHHVSVGAIWIFYLRQTQARLNRLIARGRHDGLLLVRPAPFAPPAVPFECVPAPITSLAPVVAADHFLPVIRTTCSAALIRPKVSFLTYSLADTTQLASIGSHLTGPTTGLFLLASPWVRIFAKLSQFAHPASLAF